MSVINLSSNYRNQMKFKSITSIAFFAIILFIISGALLFFILQQHYLFFQINEYVWVVPIILFPMASGELIYSFRTFMKNFKSKHRELYYFSTILFSLIVNVLMILTEIYFIFIVVSYSLVSNIDATSGIFLNQTFYNADNVIRYFIILADILLGIIIFYLIFLYVPFAVISYKKYMEYKKQASELNYNIVNSNLNNNNNNIPNALNNSNVYKNTTLPNNNVKQVSLKDLNKIDKIIIIGDR